MSTVVPAGVSDEFLSARSLPDPILFDAKWHPEQRPNIFARYLRVLYVLSPIGIVASILLKDKALFVISIVFSLGMVLSLLHSVIGKIIFPAQLIAKQAWGCTERLLINAGLEEVLVGARGIHELDLRKQKLVQAYGGRPVHITTPDGVTIDAVLFVAPGQQLDQLHAVVIHMNANMQLMEAAASAGLIEMYHEHSVNVLLFNYRGVGRSTGSITRDGVLIDAESVFQFACDGLHIPVDRIVIHARSIGGGVGLGLARLHPRVAICSERSFASLQQVVRTVLSKALGVWATPALNTCAENISEDGRLNIGAKGLEDDNVKIVHARCKCIFMRRVALAGMLWLVTVIGWGFEKGAEIFAAISGHKWLLFHPHDSIIPFEASLYFHVCSQGSKPPAAFRMLGQQDGHNRALTESEKHWHMQMVLLAIGRASKSEGISSMGYGSI